MQYASKYYDPEYAHEYYMAHRKLKGYNSSGSKVTLTEKGKAAKEYVTNTLNEQKKAELAKAKGIKDQSIATANTTKKNKTAEAKTSRLNSMELIKSTRTTETEAASKERQANADKSIEQRDKKLAQYTANTNSKISSIQEEIKNLAGLSSRDKEIRKQELQKKIDSLRADNNKMKSQINYEHSEDMAKNNETYKKVVESVKSNYNSAANAIKEKYNTTLADINATMKSTKDSARDTYQKTAEEIKTRYAKLKINELSAIYDDPELAKVSGSSKKSSKKSSMKSANAMSAAEYKEKRRKANNYKYKK